MRRDNTARLLDDATPPRDGDALLAALLRPELAELRAYAPESGRFDVRLDANEAPDMLSEAAQRRLAEAMAPRSWQRYPDARALELRAAIAERCDADVDEVLVGCGSDDVITLLLTALGRPREGAAAATIVTTSPSFVMYRTSARARGFGVIEVPLDEDWDLDVAAMRRAIAVGRPNIVFIATPNNPTGGVMSEARLDAVIAAAPDALVVLDEAYVDYAPRSAIALRRRYPNVAVLRTLSKVGFAALRVGWLIGPAALVREVDKARPPFNLPAPSQRAATVVLRELGEEVARVVDFVAGERTRVAAELVALGLEVAPSAANFLWVGTRRPAAEVHRALADRGVLVRSFHAGGGRLANRLRISLGLRAENDRLLAEMARSR